MLNIVSRLTLHQLDSGLSEALCDHSGADFGSEHSTHSCARDMDESEYRIGRFAPKSSHPRAEVVADEVAGVDRGSNFGKCIKWKTKRDRL